ncbi:MAG: PilZ domain-containing protein [Desulfobacterales bacterium]|nr:PilZ domain-containing protein [Desulfobacterales bacterium]
MQTETESNPSITLDEKINNVLQLLTIEEKITLLDRLMNEKRIDKRKTSRIHCFIQVDYSVQGMTYSSFAENISQGGVFIKTKHHVNIGEEVNLTFPVPHEPDAIEVIGKVVRITDQGIGVSFENDDITLVVKLIK